MTNPIRAGEVKPETVDWLWPAPATGLDGRIPRSMMTVIAGRPDQGKGLTVARIAADVSRDGGNVLYSAIEDSHELVTRPRLEAAGANLDNIYLWRFMLPAQFNELAQIVINKGIDLIVIDPLASHLSGGISRHSDNIRTVLNPLTDLIEQTGTAVIIIEHALKKVAASSHPLAAIGGSGSGLPAACRMGFLFGTDPDVEDRKILACVKSNICDRPSAMAFEVDQSEIPGLRDPVPSLVFEDEVVFDAIRLVTTEAQRKGPGRPDDRRAQAAEAIVTYLFNAYQHGLPAVPKGNGNGSWPEVKPGEGVPAARATDELKALGISERTLRRAKRELGIVVDPVGGGPGAKWKLDDDLLAMLVGDPEEEDQAESAAIHDDDDMDAELARILEEGA